MVKLFINISYLGYLVSNHIALGPCIYEYFWYPEYEHTLFFKRNATFLNPFFTVTLGHWPWPRVMYILSNTLQTSSMYTVPKKKRNFSCCVSFEEECRLRRQVRAPLWFSPTLPLNIVTVRHREPICARFLAWFNGNHPDYWKSRIGRWACVTWIHNEHETLRDRVSDRAVIESGFVDSDW